MTRWVVVSLLDEDQEFQRVQADDARASGGAVGIEARVVYAENNAVLQIQQLYKVRRLPEGERPLAIVVQTVVGGGLERVARAAAAAGVGWILINRTVSYWDSLRAQYPGLPIGMVSTDQKEIGCIQGRQFRALMPESRGTVLYIQGPPDTSAAKLRLEGAQEATRGTSIALRLLTGQWTEQ
jgi:ABC-type sugar transport system substrate-binding protein